MTNPPIPPARVMTAFEEWLAAYLRQLPVDDEVRAKLVSDIVRHSKQCEICGDPSVDGRRCEACRRAMAFGPKDDNNWEFML